MYEPLVDVVQCKVTGIYININVYNFIQICFC